MFKILCIVRTAIFSAYIILSGFLILALLPFTFLGYSWTRTIAMLWARIIMFATRYIAGVKYKVVGEENIEANKFYIYSSNHMSTWETMFFSYYGKVPVFVLKESLFKLPVFGLLLKRLHVVGIKRPQDVANDENYNKHLLYQLLSALDYAISSKNNFIIFPQGTRVPESDFFNMEKYPYKHGVAVLAKKLDVVPVSLNSLELFGKGMFSLKKPGVITVMIHKPMKHARDREIFMEEFTNVVNDGLKQILEGKV